MNTLHDQAVGARSTLPRLLQGRFASSGFTVIELFVVVIILCILVALIGLTYSGVRAKDRNAERQTAVDVLKGQLESYYAQTNMYPTLAELNDAAWRAKNLPHLRNNTLEDPRYDKNVAACTVNGAVGLAGKPTANCYSYQVTSAEGSDCDNDKTPCAHYTLTASLEGSEQYVKSSLN
jgi:type II secretory pathway pseudopilin PulG